MEMVEMYNYEQENSLDFTVFSDERHLPFPLNLNIYFRSLISVLLALIVIEGIRLRLKIVSYLRNPETKFNAVNILFCLDQMNGIFLVLVLVGSISFILLTTPVSELLGPFACSCFEFIAGLYISGTIVWRFSIAVLRVLFIKAQGWLTRKMGANNLLAIMIIIGFANMIALGIFMVTSDSYSYSKKICYRWSDVSQKVISASQVSDFQIFLH
jgi:hypothetical protein